VQRAPGREDAVKLSKHRDVVEMLQDVLGEDLREPAVIEREWQPTEIVNYIHARKSRYIEIDPLGPYVGATADVQALAHPPAPAIGGARYRAIRSIATVPRPRHVMLNALFLDPSVTGGPETYLRGLAPELARLAPDVHLTVVTTRSGASALRADGWSAWAEVRSLPCEDGQRVRRTVAEQLLLPVLARRLKVDLVHSLGSVAPIRAGVPAAITVHDMTFLRIRTFGRVTTLGMGLVISRASRNADALLTVSAAARDEICEILDLDPASFTVVPHGAGRPPPVEPADEEAIRARYGLSGGRVVLCVAAKRPHKNQELLMRSLPLLPPDTLVALVGHAEPYEAELRRVARELGLERRVRFIGYVSDAELEGLWRLAECAAFPTLGEGFGLPVLEAMARGVPVACSDLAVLREVGGNVPHYFAPSDAASAARAIEAAWADPKAARAGCERASQFSWEAAARETLNAYEKALMAA
jgi:glycosyltransferase involved in cell wall biosynthesis